MEMKNRVQTEGAPLYFGLAAAVLLLVGEILESGVITAYTNSMLAARNIAIQVSQLPVSIELIVWFVIFPGIFLILLLAAVNRPKRGTAFSVVWIVFAALGLLGNLYNLLAGNAQLRDLSNQLVPGGFYLYMLLLLAGYVCVLVSCILLLRRLHAPQIGSPTVDTVDPQ